MSAFDLNRLMYDLLDTEAQTRYREDPVRFTARYDLTPRERELLKECDWNGLVAAGANVYVLANYGRAVGKPFQEIGAEMRGETLEQMEAFLTAQNERVAKFAIVPEGASHG